MTAIAATLCGCLEHARVSLGCHLANMNDYDACSSIDIPLCCGAGGLFLCGLREIRSAA